MPLSEEELRQLELMERALVEDDPKLAHTLRGTTFRRTARRRVVLAGLVFALGITVLMTGAVTDRWYVGIVGFVMMLGSATIALSSMRSRQAADPRAGAAGHPSGFSVVEGGRSGRSGRQRRSRERSSAPFMERMEERWRRRRETGGF